MFKLIEYMIKGYVLIIVWTFKICAYTLMAAWGLIAAMVTAVVLIFDPSYKERQEEEKKETIRYTELLKKTETDFEDPAFKLLSDDPVYIKFLSVLDIILSGLVVVLVLQSAGGISGNLIQFIWGTSGVLKAVVVLILNDSTVKIGLCAIRTAITTIAIFMIGIGLTLFLALDVLMLLLLVKERKKAEEVLQET